MVGVGCVETPEQKGEKKMKIQVFKSVAIIETLLTVQMINALEALKPQALVLTDEAKNALFKVTAGGEPSISKYGIVISAKKDLVLQFDKPVTEEAIRNLYPQLFLHLPAVETQALAAYAEIQAQMNAVEFSVVAE